MKLETGGILSNVMGGMLQGYDFEAIADWFEVVLKCKNPGLSLLMLVFDPPCVQYDLKTGESLLLKLSYTDEEERSMDQLVTFRCEGDNLNLDINPNCHIVVVVNEVEEVIWE